QGYDFSHLAVRQAFLQNTALPDVNFAHANLATSVFADRFGSILSVAFQPHGELLAAGTTKGEIQVWQVATGIPLRTYQGHTDRVYSVRFSPDRHTIVSCGDDQTIRLWDIATGTCLKVLRGNSNRVRSVALNYDGSMLASGDEDQTVRLWE